MRVERVKKQNSISHYAKSLSYKDPPFTQGPTVTNNSNFITTLADIYYLFYNYHPAWNHRKINQSTDIKKKMESPVTRITILNYDQ